LSTRKGSGGDDLGNASLEKPMSFRELEQGENVIGRQEKKERKGRGEKGVGGEKYLRRTTRPL